MNALIIAPHPDDAEIGMGGTIASLIEQRVSVSIIDLTNGEPTPFGSVEIRAKETLLANKELGIVSRQILGLPNREVVDSIENRKKLAAAIRAIKPEILFVPYWQDAHPDHIAAAQLAEAARFYCKLVKSDIPGEPCHPRKVFHFFSTHIKLKIEPSLIVDISSFIEQKINSIAAYHSQFSLNPVNQNRIAEIRTEAAYWGAQIGVAYGEPFVCRENLAIHDSRILINL